MPFIQPDPWELQYFRTVECPEDLIIPVDETTAWRIYPHYNWLANKMEICKLQGIKHAPHGIYPPYYPMFSKPIYNLYGMSMGIRHLKDRDDVDRHYTPGHFWMELLEGPQISIDVVVIKGKPQWSVETKAHPLGDGRFDYWEVRKKNTNLENIYNLFCFTYFIDYTGIVNLEMIGDKIIEVHPRMSPQFIDLYGSGWLDAVVSLYKDGNWNYNQQTKGYSIPIFTQDMVMPKIDYPFIEELRNRKGISSIQVCQGPFGKVNGAINPPGGNRVAVINATNLKAGLKARKDLLGSMQQVHHP